MLTAGFFCSDGEPAEAEPQGELAGRGTYLAGADPEGGGRDGKGCCPPAHYDNFLVCVWRVLRCANTVIMYLYLLLP